jgi:hypothetical protein
MSRCPDCRTSSSASRNETRMRREDPEMQWHEIRNPAASPDYFTADRVTTIIFSERLGF